MNSKDGYGTQNDRYVTVCVNCFHGQTDPRSSKNFETGPKAPRLFVCRLSRLNVSWTDWRFGGNPPFPPNKATAASARKIDRAGGKFQ